MAGDRVTSALASPGYVTLRPAAATGWILALAFVALNGLVATYAVRWALAETILEVSANEPVPPALLEVAHNLQPGNPAAMYTLASYAIYQQQPPDVERGGRLLEEALAAAPERAEVWLGLARFRESTGSIDAAVAAIERAKALAPGHWKPHWLLANLMIRQGNLEASLEPLRHAVRIQPSLGPLAVRTLWTASGQDLALLRRAADGDAASSSALFVQLMTDKRLDEACEVWNGLVLPTASAAEIRTSGGQLAGALFAAGKPASAMQVWNSIDPDAVPPPGTIRNAGFEESIPERPANAFSWAITQAPEARVRLGVGRTGGSALEIEYSAPGGMSFTHATTTLRVDPGARYELRFWAQARDLTTAGAPQVIIADVPCRLREGSYEWSEYSVQFTAPASGLAQLVVGRQSCGPVCPIYGTVAIDDLVVKRH